MYEIDICATDQNITAINAAYGLPAGLRSAFLLPAIDTSGAFDRDAVRDMAELLQRWYPNLLLVWPADPEEPVATALDVVLSNATRMNTAQGIILIGSDLGASKITEMLLRLAYIAGDEHDSEIFATDALSPHGDRIHLFSGYIGIKIQVENTYADGTYTHDYAVAVPAPEDFSDDALAEWAEENLLPFTGEGREDSGHAVYEATVVESPLFPQLVDVSAYAEG